MKNYPRIPANEEYFYKGQILSSLVLNPPYKVDGFTTSPKLARILSFPFGLKLDSTLLFQNIFKLISLLTICMTASCVLILCFSLPLQHQNSQLLQKTKTLTNNKLMHVVKIQEASSYNKLFSRANTLALKDAEEIIHINGTNVTFQNESNKLITFNKYPSIQFSGF